MHVDADVGIRNAHVWTLLRFLAEIVGDGILHAVCHELAMTEILGENDRIHQESHVFVHVGFPVHFFHLLIDFVSIVCLELLDGHEDFHRGAKAEIGAIEHFLIACERHHTVANHNVVSTE